jgi:hypothetical protein
MTTTDSAATTIVVAETSLPPRSICCAVRAGPSMLATGRTPEQLTADVATAQAIMVRSATKVTAALSPPRLTFGRSPGREPAWTT